MPPPTPLKMDACGLSCREYFSPFQVDQEAVEEFNLTSDGEFRAVKSLVLGRVEGKRSRVGVFACFDWTEHRRPTTPRDAPPRFRLNARRLPADKRCKTRS